MDDWDLPNLGYDVTPLANPQPADGYDTAQLFMVELSGMASEIISLGTMSFRITDVYTAVPTFPFKIEAAFEGSAYSFAGIFDLVHVQVPWEGTPGMFAHMDASHATTTHLSGTITNVQELVSNAPFSFVGATPVLHVENGGIHMDGGHLTHETFGNYNERILTATGTDIRCTLVCVAEKINGSNPNWSALVNWSMLSAAPHTTVLTLGEHGSGMKVGMMALGNISVNTKRFLWGDDNRDMYIFVASAEYDADNQTLRQTIKVYNEAGVLVFPIPGDGNDGVDVTGSATLTEAFKVNPYNVLHIGGYNANVHSLGTTVMEVKFYTTVLTPAQEALAVSALAAKWPITTDISDNPLDFGQIGLGGP